MVIQWLTYRRAIKGAHFAFLASVVAGFGLANLWLALNVVRFYTYDAESGSKIHVVIIRVQDALVWIIAALVVVVAVWRLFGVVCWVGKRMATATH